VRDCRQKEDGRGGFGLVETLVVLFLIGAGLAIGWAGVEPSMRAAKLRAATRRMAVLVRWMQSEAVRRRQYVGIVFHLNQEGKYVFDLIQDGDGDGIRTRDLEDGRDFRFSGPFTISRDYPGIRFGYLPEGPIPSVPPSRGSLDTGKDPIRFGRSDIISFSPRGRSSSGSLYLTDGRDRMMALVIYGPTVRIRVWQFLESAGAWDL